MQSLSDGQRSTFRYFFFAEYRFIHRITLPDFEPLGPLVNSEFWPGIEKIHRLIADNYSSMLCVDLEDFTGNTRYSAYNMFGVINAIIVN